MFSTRDPGAEKVNAPQDLLRRVAAHDERYLQAALCPDPLAGGLESSATLDRRTRTLVQLAALLATDAATSSLRWAVERAAATGASDQTLVQVLETAGYVAGGAQTVSTAPRLALALDLDTGVTERF